MLDPIAEMLTKVRNAQKAGHPSVAIFFSKLKFSIAKILEKEGFVNSVSREKDGQREKIIIELKYTAVSNTRKIPAIRNIRRISREGQRIYVKNKGIRRIKNNFGIAVVSTSKGVMTGEESRKAGLGGEYICEVW